MDDQMLSYPTDKVVGIAPDRATVNAAYTALRASGIPDEDVEVFGGETAAERDGDAGSGDGAEDDGFLASVIRTVRTGFGEEATRLSALNDALDRGDYVVAVQLPGDDGDARDEEKRTVGNALHDAGLGGVAFYGRLTVEELQIGA